MYQVYLKTDSVFDPKKLLGEYGDLEKAREKVETELTKNKTIKYIIEETTGSVDSYGELIARVVEKN